MPEIRQNIITREWVVIATERAKRPDDFKKGRIDTTPIPSHDPACPFCPGNEQQTPYESCTIRNKNGNWQVRVIPNKFPALLREGVLKRKYEGSKRSMTGVGLHEVVIETPEHNLDIPLMPENEVKEILIAYRSRYAEMLKDKRIEQIIIFRNHGSNAGTSIVHPHSQIIATPIVPQQIRLRMQIAMQYHDDTGECIFCRMMKDELEQQERVIFETSHFVALTPYAALTPFHTWIFPKRHSSSFSTTNDGELEDLAYVMKLMLGKLYYGLANPDYNFCIRSVPCSDDVSEYFHWYITIIPRLTKTAGFELGSGMFINSSIPEENAKFLREVQMR
ncbi:MAG: galactose-1-phosphate uridylyltransferase [Elusimicrobiota bacterium]